MEDVTYTNLSVAFNTDLGKFAIGYMEAGVDEIPITAQDSTGLIYSTGTFSYKNRIGKVGYQFSATDRLHFGINAVGYLNEIYTYTGTGYSVDAGVIYDNSKEMNLVLSVFARNILPISVEYTDSEDSTYSGEEDLPVQIIFGAKYSFGDLDLMGQSKYDGINTLISGGLDYTPFFLLNFVTISAGYKEFSVLDSISNTTTLGAGINLFGLSLDYAYEMSDHYEYDSNNYASIGFDF